MINNSFYPNIGITDFSGLVPLSRHRDNGIINNGPKEQPEGKAKAPDLTDLFEEAKRTVQEDRPSSDNGRKQSVLARLHEPTPPRTDKTAQIKCVERDLI